MSTIISDVFSINGVIDTNRSVLENMSTIASAAASWMTYDINQGKWAIIINQAGSSVASFSDSNIIGGINVSSTGLTELYNAVEIEFPHKDLDDEKDFIRLEIDAADRYPNEPDNTLQISMDIINEPIQAELIAARELKQSRVDKIIQFRTDYTKLGLKAGDLIDITNEALGYTAKVFRIITIEEADDDDGSLVMNITALEYDANIYNTSGLTRKLRERNSQIPNKSVNTTLRNIDNEQGLNLDLSDIAKALGLTLFFNNLTGRWELSQGSLLVNIQGSSAAITWTFDSGLDLDIRARIVYPYVGQVSVDDSLGYTGSGTASGNYWSQSVSSWGPTGAKTGTPLLTDYIVWGGDNQGLGTESVFVNIAALKAAYPSNQYIVIECKANWFVTEGSTTVKLDGVVYKDGSVSQSGFGFIVAGATKTRQVSGVSVFVDSVYTSTPSPPGFTGETAPGDLVGYFVFDTVNDTAQFRNDLVGIE